LPAKMILATVQ